MVYGTFREACFAKGFLGSDQELIGALQKANSWGTAYCLKIICQAFIYEHHGQTRICLAINMTMDGR